MPSTAPAARAVHTQVWFGPAECPLFGWVSMPAGAVARGGVILCPPMGEEARAAHRTFRRLAEELAEQGLVALRFDYEGTGDSAGGQGGPGRVDAWLASIESARQFLLGLGVDEVSAVGMRLGATLAAHAAALSGGFGSLALWDPCLSGRTFIREGEALFMMGEGDGREHAPGFRHTPGFQYDDDTATQMRRIGFGKLATQQPLADRVMLLTREDRPAPAAIEERIRREPGELAFAPATGQADLLDVGPSDGRVPEEALRSIIEWLVSGAGEPVPVKPAHETCARVAASETDATPVLESTLRFGPIGLFGLHDRAPDVAPDAPWVVLINVAAEHHVGPGRRWVEFARAWAAKGYRVVRVDQSGVGDSPTHPGQHEDAPFAPEWIDDMRQVVRQLSADGSTVVVVGLCSGAYSALEVAMWEHVDAVFAVNPRLTLFPAAKGSAVYTPVRRAAVLPVGPIARLAERHRILAGGMWRIYRQIAIWHGPFRILREVVKRGTALHVLACRDDAQHFTEVLFWRPFLARLQRHPRFHFERDEVFDHSLLSRSSQLATFERATRFLETYAPLDRESGPDVAKRGMS